MADGTTIREPSPGVAPDKFLGQFGAGSSMKKVNGKRGSSSAWTFHAVGSMMLVVVWLHPSWVKHDKSAN